MNIIYNIEQLQQGDFFPSIWEDQILWMGVEEAAPATPFRKQKCIDTELLFNPGENPPEKKLISVQPTVIPDIKALLLSINPSTEQSYASELGIEQIENLSTEQIITSLAEGTYLVFSGSYQKAQD